MIIIGLILLVLGLVLGIPLLWTLGIIALVIGLILLIIGSVGHGVGLEIHESPAIRRDLDSVLPLNAVVTVEPGLYVPDWGGVRVEDVVVVGESNCRTLTTAPKLEFD